MQTVMHLEDNEVQEIIRRHILHELGFWAAQKDITVASASVYGGLAANVTLTEPKAEETK